jgi:hypothetical protein
MIWIQALATKCQAQTVIRQGNPAFNRRVFFADIPALLVVFGLFSLPARAQAVVGLAPASLAFTAQSVGIASAPQTVTLTNTGNAALSISAILVAGPFNGDFQQSSNCQASLSSGASCSINVTFAPAGTGNRTASLLVFDSASSSPQSVPVSGMGAGTITKISDSAYGELSSRVIANRKAFYVYKDADSGFNHGFPSEFGDLSLVSIDTTCVDDPADLIVGCFPSTDTTDFDATRGTVLRVTLGPFPSGDSSGLNISDMGSNSYDLNPATTVTFDVRSPDGAIVQFGVGGCVTVPSNPIALSWSNVSLDLTTTAQLSCVPNLANPTSGILFSVQAGSPNGGTVLVDNIQFTPAPARANQGNETLSFPLSTETFGVVPQTSSFPPDQINRNITTTYESALTLLAMLGHGDTTDAQEIANTFDYALFHDNQGDPLPTAPGNLSGCYAGTVAAQCGLHNAYESGDIGLLNGQGSGMGQAGDVRLAGFSVPTNPPTFDLVLDGATGGNNAFAVLALTAAYQQLNNVTYLNDSIAIANWTVANLADTTGTGYGGYYLGFPDMGIVPKTLILSKSTENNADIFAAFNLLAQIEASLGNTAAAAQWTSNANVAGSFVLAMFDAASGRFNAGTVPSGTGPGPGVCPTGIQKGNDVINAFPCDFLDANSFTTLGLAGSSAFGVLNPGSTNWQLPLEYISNFSQSGNGFTQTVTADNQAFSGFDLIPASPMTGAAWEFTGQTVATCTYVDLLYNETTFQSCAQTYEAQILLAANSAPFGDGVGVVASTLENGDTLPPAGQCLVTPFQCVPERVGLAATNWAIFADQGFNTLGPSYSLSAGTPSPASVNPGDSSSATVTITPAGGYSGIVTLSCGVSPVVNGVTAPTCSLSPNPVPVTSTVSAATLTFTTVGASPGGTYVITITGKDAKGLTQAGAPATVTVTVTSYSLSAGAASPASVNPGGSSTATITVVPANGYTGAVTLSCGISPAVSGATAPTCSFGNTNPVSVTSGAAATATLSFMTVGPSKAVVQRSTATYALARPPEPTSRRSNAFYTLWLSVAGLALMGFGLSSAASRRKKLSGLLLLSTALSALLVLPACPGQPPPTCSAVPGIPAGLQVSSTTSSGTTLNWSASTVGSGCTVTDYTVYQNGAAIATTASTNYKVTGLSASTMYSFTVAATDSSGTSTQSSSVSVTTLSSGTLPGTYTITITGKDANATVQTGGGSTVTVTVN